MVCQNHCQPHQNQTRWSRKSRQRDYSWEIAKIQKWFFFCCQNMTYHVAGFKLGATILLPLLPITGVLCSNGQREGESEWVRGGFCSKRIKSEDRTKQILLRAHTFFLVFQYFQVVSVNWTNFFVIIINTPISRLCASNGKHGNGNEKTEQMICGKLLRRIRLLSFVFGEGQQLWAGCKSSGVWSL